MPPLIGVEQRRFTNVTTSLATVSKTLEIISVALETPCLLAISNTTKSLLQCVQVCIQ